MSIKAMTTIFAEAQANASNFSVREQIGSSYNIHTDDESSNSDEDRWTSFELDRILNLHRPSVKEIDDMEGLASECLSKIATADINDDITSANVENQWSWIASYLAMVKADLEQGL